MEVDYASKCRKWRARKREPLVDRGVKYRSVDLVVARGGDAGER